MKLKYLLLYQIKEWKTEEKSTILKVKSLLYHQFEFHKDHLK